MKQIQQSAPATHTQPAPRWTKEAVREHNAQMRALKEEMQQSLPYQLGSLVLLAKHPRNWPQLPAAIRRVSKTVKALKAKNRLPISAADFEAYARSDRLRAVLGEVKATGALQAASEIAQELGYEKKGRRVRAKIRAAESRERSAPARSQYALAG